MRLKAAFEVFCLTTVYPTDTTGAHGNSGGKSAGKDVFPSGKGWKHLETSGNRYSGFLWEQDAAGSSPVTPTKIGFGKQFPKPFSLFSATQILRADDCFRQPSLNVKTAVL